MCPNFRPDLRQRQSKSSAELPDRSCSRRPRIILAFWFAGARRDVLRQCPSEAAFYNALGVAVLLTAGLSGTTMAVALGYVFHVAPTRLWPVALVWGFVIINMDRLLVMMTSSKSWTMLFKVMPRVLVSCMIAAQIAEILVFLIFGPEIGAQMQATNQQAYQVAVAGIAKFYGPQIAQDQRQVSILQAQESGLTAKVNHYRLIAACEAGEKACSVTHKLGCGPVCHYYGQLATSAQAQLGEVEPRDDAQIYRLEADIRHLSSAETAQETKAGSAVSNDTGLIAREEAMSVVIERHPGVGTEVWFVRGALLTLDLLPLILKVTHVLEGSACEEIAAARKRQESSAAYGIDLETRVEKNRMSDKALADEAINRVKNQTYRDRLIAGEEAGWAAAGGCSAAAADGVPIGGLSLDQYVGAIRGHESMAVALPRSLAIAGWVGSALIGTVMLALAVLTVTTGDAVRGAWLVVSAAVAAVALTFVTRGYQRASPWVMRACFGLLLAGLCLPPFILFTNL
ncbi:MAG TPA: DUF4407 domain-containing protein [Acidimicrobiales bacterium]|nr:DUF4407 domain-containing protein [Acidimicrobiales bacterium]